jgi:1-pyrroline-5-carboxylate dehydrogenase
VTYVPPTPVNEAVLGYAPGSPERARLQQRITELRGERIDVPCIIGGREVRTGRTVESVEPHAHASVLADVHQAGPEEIAQAVAAATDAWREWSRTPLEERLAIALRAAELLAGPWRDTINAVTILGQSKTPHQAEIDAACEAIDFLRFNAAFLAEIHDDQPISSPGVWNRMEYRPLEGFVTAISPFNFTSIAVNLVMSPAMCGNVVLWKPAQTAALAAYWNLRLLEAAGMPPGVVNLVFAPGSAIGEHALTHRDLAGVHFTGSTAVFNTIWKTIGERIGEYRSYPRLVGETGGKDFVLAHASADAAALATGLVRGAFEYQGQKCSAASRAYIPSSLWSEVRDRLVADVESIRMGDPTDFSNFMGAVIDGAAFGKHRDAIALARATGDARVIVGGETDDREGWFVEPTVIETTDPGFALMREELFGPILTVHVYDDARWAETLEVVDQTGPYGLTGAVFSTEREPIMEAQRALRHAAGNFYVNDKPTGAVVGQQPFGGARASGTNDKAGSRWNLIRWLSPRSIKETLAPPTDYRYPFLGD